MYLWRDTRNRGIPTSSLWSKMYQSGKTPFFIRNPQPRFRMTSNVGNMADSAWDIWQFLFPCSSKSKCHAWPDIWRVDRRNIYHAMSKRWMYVRAFKTLWLNATTIKLRQLRWQFSSATKNISTSHSIDRSVRQLSTSTKRFSDFSGMSAESCGKERLTAYKMPDWLEGKLKFQPKYRVEVGAYLI